MCNFENNVLYDPLRDNTYLADLIGSWWWVERLLAIESSLAPSPSPEVGLKIGTFETVGTSLCTGPKVPSEFAESGGAASKKTVVCDFPQRLPAVKF